jgi:hypothetical protein
MSSREASMESQNQIEILPEIRKKANLVIHNPELFKKEAMERAYFYEKEFAGCTQCILKTFFEIFNIEDPLLMSATAAIPGFLHSSQGSCGSLIGGGLVLGIVFGGRSDLTTGHEGILRVAAPAQRLVELFVADRRPPLNGNIRCSDISGVDFRDMVANRAFHDTGEYLKCVDLTSYVAEMTAQVILEFMGEGKYQ